MGYAMASGRTTPVTCLHRQAVKSLPSQGRVAGSNPAAGTMDANRIEDRWRQLEAAGYDLSAIWREIQHEFKGDADKYLELKSDELVKEIEKALGT